MKYSGIILLAFAGTIAVVAITLKINAKMKARVIPAQVEITNAHKHLDEVGLCVCTMVAGWADYVPLTPDFHRETIGKWSVRTAKYPAENSHRVTLLLMQEPPSEMRKSCVLVARFMEGKLSAYVSTQQYLGPGAAEVTTRIDSNPAETATLSLAADNKSFFYPDAYTLLGKLMNSEKMVVRFEPYSESPVTVTFDTSDFSAAFEPLQTALSEAKNTSADSIQARK